MLNKNKTFKHLVISVICCFQFLPTAYASELTDWKIESDIPLEKCDLQTVVNFYFMSNVKKQSEFASVSMALNQETKKLIENLPSKTKSVGEQFTKEQYSKFNENRNSKITVSLKMLLESNRSTRCFAARP
jgi:hypothetical protein